VRTTVNLDDDVLLAVQERARREKRTVGQVLSELARRGLMAPQPHPGGETDVPHIWGLICAPTGQGLVSGV